MTPLLAVDGIILYKERFFEDQMVFIVRANEPKGLALPGGFVDVGETVNNAFRREIREELGISPYEEWFFGLYSSPDRDPRQHVVSAVFTAETTNLPKAGSDAKEIVCVKVSELTKILPKLVFDHAEIVADWLIRQERKKYAPKSPNTD